MRMDGSEGAALRARLEELERQVRALKARLEILEKHIGPRVENPADRSAVREKVVFDWQG